MGMAELLLFMLGVTEKARKGVGMLIYLKFV